MNKDTKLDYLEIEDHLLGVIAKDDELFLQFAEALGITEKQFEEFIDNVGSAQCRTVNVIELVKTSLNNVYSFPDTPKGNELAEAKFKECYREHNDPEGTTGQIEPTDEDWEAVLEDGIYDDDCGYQLIISHSVR